jgi:hypothetical protein
MPRPRYLPAVAGLALAAALIAPAAPAVAGPAAPTRPPLPAALEASHVHAAATAAECTTDCLVPLDGSMHGWAWCDVDLVDHSGWQWPVAEYVAYANAVSTSCLAVRYLPGDAECAPGRGCIHVYSGDYGDQWGGEVRVEQPWSSGLGHAGSAMAGVTTIRLNDRVPPGVYAAKTTCHELGHALGFWWHRGTVYNAYSCMTTSWEGLTTAWHRNDVQWLNWWYR